MQGPALYRPLKTIPNNCGKFLRGAQSDLLPVLRVIVAVGEHDEPLRLAFRPGNAQAVQATGCVKDFQSTQNNGRESKSNSVRYFGNLGKRRLQKSVSGF